MRTAYLVIHGINTPYHAGKAYADQFRQILKDEGFEGDVFSNAYGMIATWTFAIPFVRRLVLRPVIYMTRENLKRLCANYDRVVIVAHSNGTAVIWRALDEAQVWDKPNNIYIGAFGGIIRCSYNFQRLARRAKAVFNYCSTKDRVVHFLPRLVGRGSSGYYGFRYRPQYHKGAIKGKPANTDIAREKVWIPEQNAPSNHPLVINIRSPLNPPSHGDYVSQPKYVVRFLHEIHRYFSENN